MTPCYFLASAIRPLIGTLRDPANRYHTTRTYNPHRQEDIVKRTAIILLIVSALVCMTVGNAMATDPKHANIEGTYKLVGRTMIDSTVKTAPEVIGMMTFTKTYRNLNVAWKDASGKSFSYSVISKYVLTDTSYTETKLFSSMNDELTGAGLKQDYASSTQSVPVTFDNGKVSFKLPFDPVTVVFDGDKITATAEMGFIDSWFKIR